MSPVQGVTMEYSINLILYYPATVKARVQHTVAVCQCHGDYPCLEFGSHCDLPYSKICRKPDFSRLSGFAGYSGAIGASYGDNARSVTGVSGFLVVVYKGKSTGIDFPL